MQFSLPLLSTARNIFCFLSIIVLGSSMLVHASQEFPSIEDIKMLYSGPNVTFSFDVSRPTELTTANTKVEFVGKRSGSSCFKKHDRFPYVSLNRQTVPFEGFNIIKQDDHENRYLFEGTVPFVFGAWTGELKIYSGDEIVLSTGIHIAACGTTSPEFLEYHNIELRKRD